MTSSSRPTKLVIWSIEIKFPYSECRGSDTCQNIFSKISTFLCFKPKIKIAVSSGRAYSVSKNFPTYATFFWTIFGVYTLIFKTVTCAEKVPTLSFIFSKLRSNWFEIFLFEMQLVSCCDPYQPQQGAHGQAEHHWTKLYLYLFQPFFLFRWVQIVLNQPWESAKISKYYWPKAEARSALFNKTCPLDYQWVNVSVIFFWK